VVDKLPYMEKVGGSNPSSPTNFTFIIMGLSLWGGKSSAGRSNSYAAGNYEALAPTDPNPSKFKILKVWYNANKKRVLAKIKYPNCTNFEGIKLVLFKNMTPKKLRESKLIDPHFFANNNVIARFRPDKDGLTFALHILDA
jgi:hypothetical protein